MKGKNRSLKKKKKLLFQILKKIQHCKTRIYKTKPTEMKPGKSKWIQKESLQNISNKIIKTSKFFNSVTILDRIFG